MGDGGQVTGVDAITLFAECRARDDIGMAALANHPAAPNSFIDQDQLLGYGAE
jgi:hypothetical protein